MWMRAANRQTHSPSWLAWPMMNVDDSSQQADSQPELAGLADDECG